MRKRLMFCLLSCLLLTACATHSSEDDQASIDRNAKASAINVKLGVTYLRQGDLERAKFKLHRALQQAPNSPSANDAMAYFLEQTGQTQEAEQRYLKAIRLSSGAGGPHNDYGAFLCRAKRYEAAEKQFLKAVTDKAYLKPSDAYENAGLCALSAKQENKAMTYFQLAVMRDPNRTTSLWELSQGLVKRGEYRRAQLYLDRYLNLVKKSPRALALRKKIMAHTS